MTALYQRTFRNRSAERARRSSRRCLIALLLVGGIATGLKAFEAQEPAPQGLQGILPAEAPAGLTADDFAALDGTWAQWAEGVAVLVERLYAEPLDVAGQRAALAQLRSKVRVMERALGDPAYRSIHAPLVSLRGTLLRRIELAEAMLDTLALDPRSARAGRLQRSSESLRASLTRLEDHLFSIPNGSAWLDYLGARGLQSALAEPQPSDAAVAQLTAIQRRLQRAEQSDRADVRAFASAPAFQSFRQSVTSALNAATIEFTPEAQAQLREQLAALAQGIEDYEATHASAAAAQVRSAFGAIRRTAPDGGERIARALQNHYFNYNFRIAVGEGFLNKVMATQRLNQGQVSDFVMGARIGGYQWTTTNSGVNLKPSPHSLRMDITLSGVSQSSTQGVTRQATVFTSGNHQFWATKEVVFDGDQFFTQPALISVDANNTTTGARTHVSRLPIIGRIADSIAVREAQRRRPQGEAIAASRLTGRVVPELDQAVNQEFGELNSRIDREFWQPLREEGLYPDARQLMTSENTFRMLTRMMKPGELGGSTPWEPDVPFDSVTLMVHESLLNNSADTLGFAGQELRDEEVRDRIENLLSRLLQRDVQFPADERPAGENEPNVYIFAEQDPIRFAIRNGELYLTIQSGFRREGEESIPTKRIVVPLNFTVHGNMIHVNRGTVRVYPVGRADVGAAQLVAQAGIIRNKIEGALPERQVDGTTTLDVEGRQVPVTIARLDLLNGWLRIQAR